MRSTTTMWRSLTSGLVAAVVASLLGGCPPPPRSTGAGTEAPTARATGTSPAQATEAVMEGEFGPKDGIRVGGYFGLTGPNASFGQDSAKGIRLALEELEGGTGPAIRFILHDDRCRQEDVPVVLNKLIKNDKVVVVIGEVASSLSLQGAPICQESGVPMVSPSSTNPRVTEIGDYIFRTCFTDTQQGAAMAQFALEHVKAASAALIYPQDNDYSVGLARSFADAFAAAGGKVVADEAFGKDQVDFSTELQLIKKQRPDVLFAPVYYKEAGLIARQARAMDLDIPILGGDGWDAASVAEVGGAATNNCFFGNHYSKDDDSEAVQAFVRGFRERWGEAPSAMAATAYDAMKIVAAALAACADPTDRAQVRDALAAVQGYQGLTGTISIDRNRNAVKDVVVLELVDGVQTYVTTIPAPKPS